MIRAAEAVYTPKPAADSTIETVVLRDLQARYIEVAPHAEGGWHVVVMERPADGTHAYTVVKGDKEVTVEPKKLVFAS